MDELEKDVFNKLQQLDEQMERKNVEQLAKTLAETLNLLKRLKRQSTSQTIDIDTSAKLNLEANKLKIQTEDLISDISKKNFGMLLDICYELLKLQTI